MTFWARAALNTEIALDNVVEGKNVSEGNNVSLFTLTETGEQLPCRSNRGVKEKGK